MRNLNGSDMIDLRRIFAGWHPPRLPETVEVSVGGLVKTRYWLLACLWFWTAGARVDVASIFESEPEYVHRTQIDMCRSHGSATQRAECVTQILVAASNARFYKFAVTFLPPILLVPLCGGVFRRLGKTASRRLRLL